MAVADLMKKGAKTFEERNKAYGNAYVRHGAVMAALFPDGLTLKTVEDFQRWGLVNAAAGKLTRYCANFEQGGHPDSAHDMGVYGFMLEDFDANCRG